jgi:hypothetical protein
MRNVSQFNACIALNLSDEDKVLLVIHSPCTCLATFHHLKATLEFHFLLLWIKRNKKQVQGWWKDMKKFAKRIVNNLWILRPWKQNQENSIKHFIVVILLKIFLEKIATFLQICYSMLTSYILLNFRRLFLGQS